jgi:hypothetical protein
MKASEHLAQKRARKRRKGKKQSALDVEDMFMRHHGLDRDQARAARAELDARMDPETTPVQRRALFHQIGAARRGPEQ